MTHERCQRRRCVGQPNSPPSPVRPDFCSHFVNRWPRPAARRSRGMQRSARLAMVCVWVQVWCLSCSAVAVDMVAARVEAAKRSAVRTRSKGPLLAAVRGARLPAGGERTTLAIIGGGDVPLDWASKWPGSGRMSRWCADAMRFVALSHR